MKQKRKLFDELMEGVDAMQQQREGKITLRSHDSDGEEVSRYAGETQRVGEPSGMTVRGRTDGHTRERQQAKLAIATSQFLTWVAGGTFGGISGVWLFKLLIYKAV